MIPPMKFLVGPPATFLSLFSLFEHDDIHSLLSSQGTSEKKKRSQKADVHLDTLKRLMDYLTHFKLTVAIDRNLYLLQTMKNPKPGSRNPKPEEFVRVFDILLQVHTTTTFFSSELVPGLYVFVFPAAHN